MIGSAGRGRDVQDAVLTIVTNPDLVKQNIEELKKNISVHDEAEAKAHKSVLEANKRHAGLDAREADLGVRENGILAREDFIESEKKRFRDLADDLAVKTDSLRQSEKEIFEMRNAIASEKKNVEDSLRMSKDALEKANQNLNKKADELRRREEALVEDERTLSASIAAFNEKSANAAEALKKFVVGRI